MEVKHAYKILIYKSEGREKKVHWTFTIRLVDQMETDPHFM
jgi:hypothetical protein